MTATELENRWKLIKNKGTGHYKSLQISSNCIPNLFIALDIKGNRYLILEVPDNVIVSCTNTEMENLSLEWHQETRFITIGLKNNQFTDLYNDLAISLYSRVKDIANADTYTNEFINSFYKWSEFFSYTLTNSLSEEEIKGIFGELLVLRNYLTNTDAENTNDILEAWMGPYNRTHDFVFPSFNLEVKTKDVDQVTVQISSEYQLQPETGKDLQLGLVNVLRQNEGLSIDELIRSIRQIILIKNLDVTIFLKTLLKAGLNNNSSLLYNHLRWHPVSLTIFDCNATSDFPRLIRSRLDDSINHVKYYLATTLLDNFITQRIAL